MTIPRLLNIATEILKKIPKQYLHIFTLYTFAIPIPLLELVSSEGNLIFFGVTDPLDIVLITLMLTLPIPFVILLSERLLATWHPKAEKSIHFIWITGLAMLIILPCISYSGMGPGGMLIFLSLASGAIFAWAGLKFRLIQELLTTLSPSILLFPILFLFFSPASEILYSSFQSPKNYPQINAKTPVILIVMDELPVVSLLNPSKQIDKHYYPHIAEFANHATWYRNTFTVSPYTLLAIPSLLTGQYPKSNKLPISQNYPHSIFTLLGGSYKIVASEPLTRICPDTLCKSRAQLPQHAFKRSFSATKNLIFTLIKIQVLPPDCVALSKQYYKKIFNKNTLKKAKPTHSEFTEFIGLVENTGEPVFYFWHLLLPHRPFTYLPTGKQYFTYDEYPVYNFQSRYVYEATLEYQRHLLQLAYTDALFGEFIRHLKAINLYDPALIVVASDHGISFRTGGHKRLPSQSTIYDILPVPLLIKTPFQQTPRIIEKNAETIDIVPTIADILKIKIPWKIDGRPLTQPATTNKEKSHFYFEKKTGKLPEYKHLMPFFTHPDREAAFQRKFHLFALNGNNVVILNPLNKLLGTRPAVDHIAKASGVRVRLLEPEQYINVDPASNFVPAYFKGEVFMDRHSEQPITIAISVNGKIVSLAETFNPQNRKAEFAALLHETGFRKGKNILEFYRVEALNHRIRLEKIEVVP